MVDVMLYKEKKVTEMCSLWETFILNLRRLVSMQVRLLPLIGNTSGFTYSEPSADGVGHGFDRERALCNLRQTYENAKCRDELFLS